MSDRLEEAKQLIVPAMWPSSSGLAPLAGAVKLLIEEVEELRRIVQEQRSHNDIQGSHK